MGKIKNKFEHSFNPEQHIRKSSIAIHGITEEMVKDAPTEAEIPQNSLISSKITLLLHTMLFLITASLTRQV